jgi:ATP-dependent RNA helicase RhlE
MNDFKQLNLSPVLQGNLAKHGFVLPTPVQAQAIPPALEGRDVVATAQTGTGKTLGFALPLLQRLLSGPLADNKVVDTALAVVLSPTRELAIQIHETFLKLTAGTGIRSAVVVGGMSETNQLRLIRKGVHVLIATPGRLCDFLQRKLVRLGGANVLVLDEADRMLDMGFLPSIRAILKETPATRQTLLFSATIEKSVAHLIHEYVKDPVRIAIGSTTKMADQVDLHTYEIEQDRKLGLLRHLLAEEPGAFLVFARTKHGADKLAKNLGRAGVDTTRIHGDRTQGQRNQALQGFKDGTYRVLVATDVAARGIHVDNIAHVVNFDLPQVPEDFLHRAGRTGRAGAKGVASTFATRQERSEIKRIERELKVRLTPKDVPAKLPEPPGPAPFGDRELPNVVVIPTKTWNGGRQDQGPGRGAVRYEADRPYERQRSSESRSYDSKPAGSPYKSGPYKSAGAKSSGYQGANSQGAGADTRTGFRKAGPAGSGRPAFGKPAFGKASGQSFGPKKFGKSKFMGRSAKTAGR